MALLDRAPFAERSIATMIHRKSFDRTSFSALTLLVGSFDP